ncbi:MAG: alcohol dehydrogenase catalytic domain-containing protein [Hyphomicrobiaceae bacterium]|nr:alcohol dehydrogenase catalytic domain-containing protein [Hyphomicrobiaceae bacterium]
MKALQKTHASFGLELKDVAEPAPPEGSDVVIEVAACGVCGTDVHIYEWTGGYEFMAPALPKTIGHEFSGRIVAVGSEAKGVAVGDRVTCIPFVACGTCEACRADDIHLCGTPRPGIGFLRDGAFTRLVSAPAANCVRLPDNVPDEVGALIEPLTIGARAVQTGGVKPGDRVLVLGPGPIGQCIALMARRAGASEVVVVGKGDAARLDCLRRLGFERVVDIADGRMDDGVRAVAGAAPFDVAFEATGVPPVVEIALSMLRRGGVLTCVGIMPAAVTIDLTRMVREQKQIRGSHRGPRAIWLDVVEALRDDPQAYAPMITHRLALEQGVEGMELARSRSASKVLLFPDRG